MRTGCVWQLLGCTHYKCEVWQKFDTFCKYLTDTAIGKFILLLPLGLEDIKIFISESTSWLGLALCSL